MPDSITLKDDFTFLVTNDTGDVTQGLEGYGMYLADTRYLSRLELTIDGQRPETLSHTADYNIGATFRLSSPYSAHMQLVEPGQDAARLVAHGIGLARRRYIKRGLIESLELTNYHTKPVKAELSVRLGADFADMFEVRGMPRMVQGHGVAVDVPGDGRIVEFRTVPAEGGPSDTSRTLRFECNVAPANREQVDNTSILNGATLPEVILHYHLDLQPNTPVTLHMRLLPDPGQAPPGASGVEVEGERAATSFAREVAAARRVFAEWQQSCTQIETGNYVIDKTLETSTLDLRSLMQQEPQGLVVTAGLPWYFTLFGRDSLITALETLCLNPQIAIDTLRALAAYQATRFDDWRDSEPGKILHELRRGDMTLNGETPHSPYYGSVDSTLLFILTFAETLKWVNSPDLFSELWPNVERALTWAEKYGDMDGDGYIEFSRRSTRGIRHQGWKDSDESMGGPGGPWPEPPIALVEVQGYYYAALIEVAFALRNYGTQEQVALAGRLVERAARLKEQFNRDFWWEEAGFFAQALDGKKQQVRSITSNPGHCLWNGIVDEDKARSVVARFMQPDMLSGWGIRTMSTGDPTYNPMSYHNGSIWPHDNAIIIAGLKRYGFLPEMLRVTGQILDAATAFEDFRPPELYCGFPRGEGVEQESAPAAYPVSCSPQAWAAGTPLLIVQSLLGLEPDAAGGSLSVDPVLPAGIDRVSLRGLRVGNERLDLSFARSGEGDRAEVTKDASQASAGRTTVRRAGS